MIKKALGRAKVELNKVIDDSFKRSKRLLQYARLNDENNNFSLTNMAMIIVMYKMAVTDATSWQDMTALAIAISSYQVKRAIDGRKKK